MPRPVHVIPLALALTLFGVAGAADEPAKKSTSADLEIWVIRASTKSKDISPELKSFADKLKQRFKYTGFRLERKIKETVDLGKTFTTPLTGGYQAMVTPKTREKDKGVERIALQLQVLKEKEKKPRMNIEYKLEAGTFQPFGAWDLEGGDVLIILLSAK